MTGKQENRDALIRLATALVEDVLNASNGEILSEAHEDKVDVESVASAGRSEFESIAAAIAKRRLTEAKAAVAAQRSPATVTRFDLVVARRHLERLLAQDPRAVQFLVNPGISRTRLMLRAARQRAFRMLSHPEALIRL